MVGKPINVTAYGIVSYTEAFFYLIFEGIALGTQPITTFNTGTGLKERVIKARNLAFAVTLAVAFIGVTILYSLPDYVVYLFAGNNQLLQPVAINGMHLYFWVYLSKDYYSLVRPTSNQLIWQKKRLY